ncbi:DNA-directed DNA polymerase [Purpureocillium takamizusanense]|uniref:DNA-directed DNA polymerase n=1 Tax=Purpureocillium takamizusanense TaxID=2060973 RepID=A0A9Q8VEK5_9HYPO|nr:DNA-directed DNA polymerase [Purpureocillium takamizusanense]UNI21994.1 DNA-directed DNA polymerase [Purpureocillium takamizusanense]
MPYNTTAIPPRKEPTGQTQLPLSRVKKIIAQDRDVVQCSNNAAFVITCATEMFIQHLAEAALNQAKTERKPRRNIQYKDVANAVAHQDNLEFLEDVAPKTIPFKKVSAASREAQARMRGDKTAPAAADNGTHRRRSNPHANGLAAVNGNGSARGLGTAFSVALRDDRASAQADDPNEQLELEMRQAAGARARDGDVHMSG